MARIIASLFATSREQVARMAQKATMAGADWLELRLDGWPAAQELAPAIAACRLPVLVACRTPEHGGGFRGTLTERRELLQQAIEAGATGLDLDGDEPWWPALSRARLKLRIRSFHSFTGVPKELRAIRDQLLAGGGIAKLAVTAHDLADAAPVLELLAATDQREQPTIAFAMGRTAAPTRVLSALLGAPFVYGCIEPGTETAVGQLPVGVLAGLYRVQALGPGTVLCGLLGNPALGSLGPWLHNRAFARCGFDGVYLPFETSRPEAVLAMLPRRHLRGLSVTAPCKATMAGACHRLADDAAATGVVNTIVAEAHGLLVGHNTDVAGVLAALATVGITAGQGKAAVLGTGGAARGGAIALRRLGYQVVMLGRSLDGVREFGRVHGVQLASLSERVLDELSPAVVVQATPVGGADREGEARLLPGYRPRPGTVILDMVYQPRWTRFLVDAAAAGAIVVPGVEMFLGQAQAQVRWFTGQELPVAALRSFLAGSSAGGAPPPAPTP